MKNEDLPPSQDPLFELSHLCRYFSERSPLPMLAVEGPTSIVRHVNRAFLGLAAVTKQDVIGRPFALGIPEDRTNGCASLIEHVFKTGVPETLLEQQHRQHPATYWSYNVWPILGKDECPVGVMIQITDSTETALFRSQAVAINESLLLSSIRQHELTEGAETLNQKLKAAIAEKEYFIAVLSHELRTPLTPILIATQMLQRNANLNVEMREYMEMIHRNASMEARLIDDLLDITRIDRGKVVLDRHPVDLRMIIGYAVDALRSDIDSAALTVVLELGEHPLVVSGDSDRLQQVFSNLLRNAIKFTPAGGSITASATMEGDVCVTRIIDTGAGMEPGFLPRAFTPFEQEDKSHTRKGGLGLGLTISQTIINLHEGSLTADSAGANRGSTFSVKLPAVSFTQAAAGPDRSPPLASLTAIRPLRILLVEDHVDTARTMRRLLTAEGHQVEWAPNIFTGLELAGTHEFDLLLSDVGLPDGTGVDMMRTLRQRGSLLPGIVLSGFGQDQDIARSHEAGFSAHLVKPLSLPKLHEAILALVG